MANLKRIILSLLAITLVTPLFAQEIENKNNSYGNRVVINGVKNKNLRFTDPEKIHTEISISGLYSGGNYSAYGAAINVRRQHRFLGYGVQINSEYSREYGVANSAALLGGMRFGKKVSFGIDALAGYGQSHVDVLGSNPSNGDRSHSVSSVWRPYVAGQASLNFLLGKNVMLSVIGGYKHSFFANSDSEIATEENWQIDQVTLDANRWYAGLSLAFLLKKGRQISGDNCWRGEAFGGWSNLGWLAGARAIHFHRNSYYGGSVLGFGTEYTINGKSAANGIFAQAGYQFLPWGEKSPLVFDLGGQIGFAEYAKTTEASTEDGERYRMASKLYSPGGNAKIYAGFAYHNGGFTIGCDTFAGYWLCTNSQFAGDLGFQGTYSKNHGFLYGAVAKLAFSF